MPQKESGRLFISIIALLLCFIIGNIFGYFILGNINKANKTEEVYNYKNEENTEITTVDLGENNDIEIEENLPPSQVYGFQKEQLLGAIEGSNTQNGQVIQAVSNVKSLLSSENSEFYPIEIPLSISRELLFQFVDAIEVCDTLEGNSFFDLQELTDECKYEFYYRKTLESKGDFKFPLEANKGNNSIELITSNNCNIEENYICLLISEPTNTTTRSDFKKLAEEFLSENNLQLTDISPASYGYFNFFQDLSDITIPQAADIFYDRAVFVKAVYNNSQEICGDILSPEYKNYCEDYFNGNNTQYYQDLLKEFHSLF